MGDSLQAETILDQLLEEVHQLRLILNGRLSSLENSVCFLTNTCNGIVTKLESLDTMVHSTYDVLHSSDNKVNQNNDCHMNPGVGGGSNGTGGAEDDSNGLLATAAGVLRLPGVETYPDGTWLGDPDDTSRRVRSPITPQNLLHINSTCVTAEKMALTLLDYLFSRDELASSNISGRSRNNKKQLDPMMVYGIRCHLHYKFNITTKEWNRICQNMDSKCRSAWKRKKNQPSLSQPPIPNKIIKVCHTPLRSKESPHTDDISFDFDELNSTNLDLSCVKVMGDSTCALRILHAGAGSYDALPDTHEIVLAEDRILTAAAVEESDGLLLGRGGGSSSLRPVSITSDIPCQSGLHHEESSISSMGGGGVPISSSSESTSFPIISSTRDQLHHQCSASLASSSISLQECTERSLDSSEDVIVITGAPASDSNILEIAVADSLQQLNEDHHHHHHHHNHHAQHHLHDPSHDDDSHHHHHHTQHHLHDDGQHLAHHGVTHLHDTPPPSYKLQPYPPLQLHSSTNKHEMNDQDISDELDEPINGLPHLGMSSLVVMNRGKGDMDLKDIKNSVHMED